MVRSRRYPMTNEVPDEEHRIRDPMSNEETTDGGEVKLESK